MRIAVLISGRGSNMLQLAAHAGPASGFEIVLVAANKACDGLAHAEAHGLWTHLVSRADFASQQDQEAALGDVIVEAGAEIICLAGYMAILSPAFVERFAGRIINIHPSLLPAFGGKGFYGNRVHTAVIEQGVTTSGCTVHFVDNEYDHGSVLLQRQVPVASDDSPETLAARVFLEECEALPEAINLLAQRHQLKQ